VAEQQVDHPRRSSPSCPWTGLVAGREDDGVRAIRHSVFLLIVVVIATVTTPAAADETLEVLDGRGGTDGRIRATVATDVAAVRHGDETWVFYGADPGDGHDLRLARLGDDGTDSFRTLDGASMRSGRTTHDVGADVSAVVHEGLVHVFYVDATQDDLRHAWRAPGAAWRFETIDGHASDAGRTSNDVGALSTAVAFRDRVQVFYVDRTQDDIRRAVLGPVSWRISTIDGHTTRRGRTAEPLGDGLAAAVWSSRLHVLYTGATYEAGLREAVFAGDGPPAFSLLAQTDGGLVSLLRTSRSDVYGVFEDFSHVRPIRWRDGAWQVSFPTWDTQFGAIGMTVFADGERAHIALGLFIGYGSGGSDEYVAVAPWQPWRRWSGTYEAYWWSFPPGAPNAAVTIDGVGHLFVGGFGRDIGGTGRPALVEIVGPFEGEVPF
jgi:hypothetical protein